MSDPRPPVRGRRRPARPRHVRGAPREYSRVFDMAAPRLASGTAGRALKSTHSALERAQLASRRRRRAREDARKDARRDVRRRRVPRGYPFDFEKSPLCPFNTVPVQHPGTPRCDLVPLFVTRSHSTETVSIKSETASSRSRRSCRLINNITNADSSHPRGYSRI